MHELSKEQMHAKYPELRPKWKDYY
jgi:hypothetical protein